MGQKPIVETSQTLSFPPVQKSWLRCCYFKETHFWIGYVFVLVFLREITPARYEIVVLKLLLTEKRTDRKVCGELKLRNLNINSKTRSQIQ